MNAWATDLISLAVQHTGKNWGGHGVCVCVCVCVLGRGIIKRRLKQKGSKEPFG